MKRKSQALLPILELPENLNLNCNLDPEVDADPDLDTSADHVIQYQDKIRGEAILPDLERASNKSFREKDE